MVRDLSSLMRQELALAQVEFKSEASKTAKGAVAGAGVAGHFVLLFLTLALWTGCRT